MKKKTKKTRIEELTEDVIATAKKIRKLEEENQEVFDEHRSLMETMEGLKETLKIEARKLSVEGETKVVFESPDLMVSVQGKKAPIVYNYTLAKEYWSEEILERARVKALDPKVIKKLVEQGRLDLKKVQKISSPGEPITPAVTIKVVA